MEEEKKTSNPEVAKEVQETITVKLLVKGEPGDSDATLFTYQAPKVIETKLDNAIFATIIDPVKSNNSLEGEQRTIWLDARSAAD